MNRRGNKGNRIALNWSRLLGFDQADKLRESTEFLSLADPGLARIGAKVGVGKTAPVRKIPARS